MLRQPLRLSTGILAAAFLTAALCAPAAQGRVVLKLTNKTLTVPPSFFGLSFEQDEFQSFENRGRLFDRMISLVRAQDGSPLLLRLGGKSADDAYWQTPPIHTPSWVFELDNNWVKNLAALVQRNDLRVVLDVNLAVHSPTMASDFAQAIRRALPAGGLAQVAVGDEPDLFKNQPNLARERVSTTKSLPSDWPRVYSPHSFRSDFRAYARALRAAVPGIPLDGPEIASSTPAWTSSLNRLGGLGPTQLTVHRYPFSNCWPKGTWFYPSIRKLLSQGATYGLALRVRGALAVAGRLPVRVSEMNSISCGGTDGVANSFATALWAPDALFEMLHAGVIGVNWHIRSDEFNAPFVLTRRGVEPRPELYGLAAFAEMVGPGAALVHLKLAGDSGARLKVWAVSSQWGLRLLLINKSGSPVNLELDASASGRPPAQVTELKAPSVTSTSGVTLGGRWIGADGRWHGHPVSQTVSERRGTYSLVVPPYSGEIVRLTTL